jgi:hypothetical protein
MTQRTLRRSCEIARVRFQHDDPSYGLIDFSAFPHIVEQILDNCNRKTTLAFAQTCKRLQSLCYQTLGEVVEVVADSSGIRLLNGYRAHGGPHKGGLFLKKCFADETLSEPWSQQEVAIWNRYAPYVRHLRFSGHVPAHYATLLGQSMLRVDTLQLEGFPSDLSEYWIPVSPKLLVMFHLPGESRFLPYGAGPMSSFMTTYWHLIPGDWFPPPIDLRSINPFQNGTSPDYRLHHKEPLPGRHLEPRL